MSARTNSPSPRRGRRGRRLLGATLFALALLGGTLAAPSLRAAPAAEETALRPASDFDRLGASDRPAGHEPALVAGIVLAPLFLVGLAWRRRRALARWLRGRGPASPRPPVTRREALAALGAIGVAALVRFWGLGEQIMHEDEWVSVEFLPVWDVLFHGYEVLTNPPLLNVIEHYFYAHSIDPGWFRIPVALAGTALVWAVWWTGREVVGRGPACAAALLAALHAGLIAWSQTVRGYVPVAFLTTWAALYAWRLARGGRDRDAVMLGIVGALALWTHYVAGIALVVMFALVAWARRNDRAALRRLVAVGAWLTIAFLPLAPFFLSHLPVKQGSGVLPGYVGMTVAFLTGLPLWLGWPALGGLLAARPWRQPGTRWVLGIAGGFLLLTSVSTAVVFQVPMYSMPVVPLLLLALAAALLAPGPARRLRRAALAAVVLAMLVPTALLRAVPSESTLVARIARPFHLRGVSHGPFAREVVALGTSHPTRYGCERFVTSPAFDVETYLYHLGPFTFRDVGAEPIVEHAHMTFPVDVPTPRGARRFVLQGLDREGEQGPVALFDRLLEKHGCFWYSRMHQSCANGTGILFRQDDCDWLAAHCERLAGFAEDELWYCPTPSGESAPSP